MDEFWPLLGLLDKTEGGVSVSCEAQRTKSNQITDSGPVVALPVPGLQINLDHEGSAQWAAFILCFCYVSCLSFVCEESINVCFARLLFADTAGTLFHCSSPRAKMTDNQLVIQRMNNLLLFWKSWSCLRSFSHAKMSKFWVLRFSDLRILCFSLLYMIFNWIYLNFGLFFLVLGHNMKHFSSFSN